MLKRGFQFAPGYRLQEFLGRGQFGQVWRATAPGGAAAAVKFIDLSDGQGQKEYDAIKRVKQIRHANLMPITAIWLLDAQGKVIEEAPDEAIETIDLSVAEPRGESAILKGVDPSWLVVSMLLGGKSLQQRLRECVEEGLPGIPPKELISYMDESAKGIDFLNAPQHDLGEGPIAIQHSDVKPANIVLIGSSAVVCDFGLARILTRNQVTATSAAGTPAYMAPEAISGKPSRTSDQYSLAVTYYHLRTGALPVNDGSLWEVLDAHRMGRLKLGLVPETEQEVLRKATDLNWENRFKSNVEMVDALREALRVEGHTRPSFLPTGGGASAGRATATAATAAEVVSPADDPTATIDTAMLAPDSPSGTPSDEEPPDQAMQATQPFVQAEHQTGDNFLDETLPELQESPGGDGAAEISLLERIKRQPKLLAGVGGVLVLILAVAIGTSGNDEPPDTPEKTDPIVREDSGRDTIPPDEKGPSLEDANQWLQQALALLGDDEAAAVELFQRATQADAGLSIVPAKELSGHKNSVMFAEAESTGKWLVTAADQPIAWNMTAAEIQPMALAGHTDLVESVSIHPGGERMITAGYDFKPLIWNLSRTDVVDSSFPLIGHADAVLATAWHPDEMIVVTTSADPTIGVWQLGRASEEEPNGTVAKSNRFPTTETMKAAMIDAKGRWLATISDPVGGGEKPAAMVFRWQDVIGTLSVEAAPQPIVVSNKNVEARKIAFAGDHQDAAVLAVADAGGSISLYELTGQPKLIARSNAHQAIVEDLKIVPGTTDVIVSGSSDGTVHWWQSGATERKESRPFSANAIASVDVSPSGRWVAAGSFDGSVWLWDAAASKHTAVRLSASSQVNVVRIDPLSQWLAAGCNDGTVLVWDLKWAKLIAITQPTPVAGELEGPTKTIDAKPLAFLDR